MHKKRLDIDLSRSVSTLFGSRQGQVTVFIIVGILLLLAIALIIAFQKEIISFRPEELIPTEKGNIENFITACLDSVGEDALFKMGLQGGYITVPAELANDRTVHLRVSPFTVIPYWAYGQETNIPSLDDIKFRLDSYIEDNLAHCLFETSAFQEKYDLIEKNAVVADTAIVDRGVLFTVQWNVEIRDKAGNVVTELLSHSAESPIKLKALHQTAQRIVQRELRDLKLEDITQDLIALEHPDVPVAGLEVSCRQKKWEVEDVKTTLKNLLRVNLRELKIQGTEFVKFPEELPYYQNHYVWNLGEEFQEEDVSVSFNFDDSYPFSFDVRPRQGALLKSSQLGGENELLSVLCMQTWKFSYDVSYPVLVTLHDETTGYDFKIALTVHLRRNIPDRSGIVASAPQFFDTYGDESYCQQRSVPMTVYTYELLENEQTGLYDSSEPVDNADLRFTCLRYSCDIGQTQYNFANMGNIAAYRTNFPYCAGGIIRAEKTGYKEAWERVVTEPNKETTLFLVPLFSFPLDKVKVVKHQLLANSIDTARELAADESVIMTLTYNKKEQPLNEPYHKSSVVWSQSLDPEILKDEKLSFLGKADFSYVLSIDLLNENEFKGGYRGNWTVPWRQLQEAEEIIFHVVSDENPSEQESLELLLGLGSGEFIAPLPEIR